MCLLLARAVSAQVATGTVAGSVKDAQGAAIPGVTIELTSESRGTKLAPVVTNTAGDFVFPNLTPDTYTIDVSMSGFKPLRRTGIPVSPGGRASLPPFALELGSVSETVTVSSQAPLIQAQSGERSFSLTTEAVQNLPIRDRSFASLLSLAPGTIPVNPAANGGVNAQVNGVSGALATIDGVATVDSGGNQVLIQLNTEAVSEVKILTGSYQAEYGRSQGAQITAVTKSGTNRFHASAYDIKRDSAWNAINYIDRRNGSAKPVVKEQDWGYSLGGPVGRSGANNKIFFFFSQEWRPRTAGGTVSRFRVPTAAERNGDFSASRDNNGAIYNLIRDHQKGSAACSQAAQATCFNDGGVLGKIPTNRLYAPGLAILKMYPLPNIGDNDLAYTSTNSYNYEEIDPQVKSTDSQSVVRVDYAPSSRLRFSGKYLIQTRSKVVNAIGEQFGSNPGGRIAGFNDFLHLHPEVPAYSGTANYTLNATTFAEVSLGYSGNDFSNMPVNGDSRAYGLNTLPAIFPNARFLNSEYFAYKRYTEGTENGAAAWFDAGSGYVYMLPTMAFGNRIANAPPNLRAATSNMPILAYVRTKDVTASLTKIWSSHTFKFGYWRQGSVKYQGSNSSNTPGSYNFGQSAAGANPFDSSFGFSNAALGVYQQVQQFSTLLEGKVVYTQNDFFAQDNWKVNNKLTLDYGIRVVNQGPQYDELRQTSNFLPDTYRVAQAPRLYRPALVGGTRVGFDAVTGTSVPVNQIGLVVPDSGNRLNGIHASGTDISKYNYLWPSVVYAPRFGFAYDLTGAQKYVVRGGGGVFYDRPAGNAVFNQLQNPPFATAATLNNGLLSDLSTQKIVLAAPGLQTFQYNSKIPTVVPWSIGLQAALPWASVLDISYVGSHSFNQLIGYDVNAVPFGAAYLAGNQDATLAASATPGATALPTVFLRPFIGFDSITRQSPIGYGNFRSLQTSFTRRFSHGVAFGLNYTYSKNEQYAGTPRVTSDANAGTVTFNADDKKANYNISGNDRTHIVKGNFVWDLPDMRSSGAIGHVIAGIANDWQLSGIYTAGSGAPYTPGFSYAGGIGNVNLTGSPNYAARIITTGDTGSGCSSDPTRQFNAAAFSGPQAFSDGLESRLNFLRGCADNTMDLTVQRNIRMGQNRQLQIRFDMFNVLNSVIYSGRQATLNLNSLATASVATNAVYDTTGALITGRDIPRSAGFGAVTAAQAARSTQLQVRFQF